MKTNITRFSTLQNLVGDWAELKAGGKCKKNYWDGKKCFGNK